MNKKRVLILLLVLALAMSMLAGCNKPTDKSTEAPAAETGAAKKIIVGTSAQYYPWAYQENDEIKGFEIDVWKEIAKRNNYELEFKLSKFSGLVGMLDTDEIDTIAHQMSITEERLEKYDFSEPYAYSYYDFFIKEDSTISTLEDLKGQKVGCMMGGNGERTLREINEKNNLNMEIVAYDGVATEQEVVLGRVVATWQGEIKTKTTIADNNLPLKQLNQKLVFETNAYPFKKSADSKVISEEVSKALKEMRQDGTLLKLSQQWFGIDTVNKPE